MDILDLTGVKIRQMREDLSWTREFLSEKSGVPPRTIADIETGISKNPGIETLKQILSVMPNYPKNAEGRASLILTALGRLNSLNMTQLQDVLDSIEHIENPIAFEDEETSKTSKSK